MPTRLSIHFWNVFLFFSFFVLLLWNTGVIVDVVINMNEIAERIAQAMEKQNISYGELARITGIPKSAVYRYVTGETEKMPLPRLELIAKALHVAPEYLLGWEEPAPAKQEDDDELLEYLEYLRTRPEARILMSTMRGATKEEVEENVRFIEALRKTRHGND